MNTHLIYSIGHYKRINLAVLLCLLVLTSIGSVYGVTPAGTIIKNQASASYRDTQGVRRIATSNLVENVIRQVAAMELALSQSKPGTAGQEVIFTHTLTNTGNGTDRFTLSLQSPGSNFNLADPAIYTDNDRDGQIDSYSPVAVSPQLQAGESWSFIVAGNIPFDALDNESGVVVLTAGSIFDNSVNDSNTDTVVVTDSAVVEISKQISAISGASPGGPFTVRIRYKNITQVLATDVILIDALPPGMSYLADTGRWSGAGGLVLTDANANDSQAGGIRYCAYDSTCTGLLEANADNDSDSTNQVTGILAEVGAGESGYVEFDVTIDAGLPSGVLINTAELQYTAGGTQVGLINSNPVPFTVAVGAGVVINGSTSSSVDGTQEPLQKSESVFGSGSGLPVCQSPASDPDGDGYGWENSAECIVENLQAGNSLFYKNTVWNLGNTKDSFDITTVQSTFPADTLFVLLKADSQTPLLDTNGNGIPDTGLIPVGGSQTIVLQVILPVGISGDDNGAPFGVTTVATSTSDSNVGNSMLNLLQNSTSGSVDITNTTALGNTPSPGQGTGPESEPVTTLQAIPGSSVDFDLVVNNTSDFPMEFTLAASIYSDFSTVELPPQWQLEFVSDDGLVISSTGVIASGDSFNVTARVTLPALWSPSVTSLYFRAQNEVYAVQDIKHDAVSVASIPSLLLGINQEGQVQPGGSRVYNHTLVNTGNADVSNISLTVTDSLASEGFNSLLYEDTDGDGVLSTADQLINTLMLASGEARILFVKVYVPGTASNGMSNFSELTVSAGTDVQSVTDVTNVTTGIISVLKEQALDNLCDGVLDSNYSSQVFSVAPGNNCVRYRLTAFNAGSVPVLNVVVADATPTFTSYTGSAICSLANCTVTEPGSGSGGDIIASLPELLAGDSVVVEFMVRID